MTFCLEKRIQPCENTKMTSLSYLGEKGVLSQEEWLIKVERLVL